MEPCDFHKTAELLKDCVEESHRRTSISRSYYGVFLYFREFFAKKGLTKQKKKKQDPHAFVCNCLQFCEVKEGAKAAMRLKDLYQWRSDADYDLDKTFSDADANDRLDDARQTINDFKSTLTPTKTMGILKGATNHAKAKGWI
ncbi:MAG: hypothetical protein KAV87_66485 [Desulfobacteraceae bacterium]|nr:hypothetical protein [Desulfobacteraceae bacterium]